jgi:hypothetical protein
MTAENRKAVTAALACLEHRPRPNLSGIYAQVPLGDFIGTSVLLGFKGKDGLGAERFEYMWVHVTGLADARVHGDELVGVIDNVPFLVMEYECGDTISFRREEIQEDRILGCCEHIRSAASTEVKN